MIPKDFLRIYFDSKQEIFTVNLKLISYKKSREKKEIKELNDVQISSDEWIDIESAPYIMNIDFSTALLRDLKRIYKKLGEVTEEERRVIDEFSPDTLAKLSKLVKDIFYSEIEYMLKHSKITINIKNFETTEELGRWFFREVIGFDELQPKLEELREISNKLEDLRKDLLKTSYA
ncbi:MAG: hypothetical protein PWR13_966 [Archaeoglobi archaeon]|nr:hypothetical protein [Archaeoglobi archaeon]